MAVVGTAYVRVKMLTDRFEKDLDKSINKALKSATASSDASSKKAGRELGDQLAASASKAIEGSKLGDKITESVTKNVDETKIRKRFRNIFSKKFNKVEFDASLSTSAIDDHLAKYSQTDAKVAGKKILHSILAQLHPHKIADKINDGIKQAKNKAEVEVKALTSGFIATMMWVTRPAVKQIILRVNKKSIESIEMLLTRASGFRAVKDLGDSLWRMTTNLDKTAPMFGLMASGISALVGAGGALVGWLSIALVQLGSLAALALPLPAMFLGGGAAIGVLVVALKDLGGVLEPLADDYKKLGNEIKASYWEEALNPVYDLGEAFQRMGMEHLPNLGAQLGLFTRRFAQVASSEKNMSRMGEIIDLTSVAVTNASNGIGSMVSGILGLGAAGARYLPLMGTWFSDISKRFENWVEVNTNNGNMFDWIDTGIENFKMLWGIIKNLGGVIGGIARAAGAAGGGGFATMADSLERLHTSIDSVAGQQVLTQFFTASKAAGDNLALGFGNLIGSLGRSMDFLDQIMVTGSDAIRTALTGIGSIFENLDFQAGLGGLIDGFDDFVGNLSTAVGPISTILGAIGGLAGTALKNLGPLLATAFTTIAPAAEGIRAVLEPIIEVLSRNLRAAFEAAAPYIETFSAKMQAIGPAVGPAIQNVIDKIAALVAAVQQNNLGPIIGVGAAFAGIAVGAGMLFTKIAPLLTTLSTLGGTVGPLAAKLGGMGGIMTKLGGAFKLFLGPVGLIIGLLATLYVTNDKFRESINGVLSKIMEVVGGVGTALMPLLDVLMTVIGQIADAVLPVIATALEPVIAAFMTLLDNIVPLVQSIVTLLVPAIQGLVDFLLPILVPVLSFVADIIGGALTGAINGVTDIIQGLTSVFDGLVQFITGVFTGNWSQAWEGIKQIFSGVFEALWGVVQVVWNVGVLGAVSKGWALLKNLFSGGVALVKGIFSGGWNFLKNITTTVWNGILGVLRGVWNGIKGGASALGSSVKTLISNAWNAVKNTTSSVWNGIVSFIKGIPAKFMSGLQSLGNLGAKAAEWFGKFVSTAKSKFDEAVSFARGIPGKMVSALGNVGSTLVNSGRSLISGFINGITAGFRKARDAVSSGLSSIRKFFPFSPAKVGPFSGRGYTTYSGYALVRDFGVGMTKAQGSVVKAADAAMARVASGFHAAQTRAAENAYKAAQAAYKKNETAANKSRLASAKARYDATKKAMSNQLKVDKSFIAQAEAIDKAYSDVYKRIVAGQGSIITIINRELAAGLSGTVKQANTVMYKLVDTLYKMKTPKTSTLGAWVETQRRALESLVSQRESGTKRLEDANKRLEDALKAKTTFRDRMYDNLYNVGGIFDRPDKAPVPPEVASAEQMIKALRSQVNETNEFKKLLSQVRSLGLTDKLYEEISQMGTAQGSAVARQIIAGGSGAISELNRLSDQLNKASKSMADTVAGHMYDAGINAAKGIVDGLIKQQNALNAAIQQIAESLVAKLRDELQIRSPSRVTAKLGEQTSEGMVVGLLNRLRQVRDAAGRIADASVPTSSQMSTAEFRPLRPGVLAAGLGAAGGGESIFVENMTIEVGVDELDDLVTVKNFVGKMKKIPRTTRQKRRKETII